MCYPSFRYVHGRVEKALRRFYQKNLHLLQEEVHERSMTAKLSECLQPFFKDWNVDCEYNRNTSEPNHIKSIPGHRPVYPDIIIHRRGTDNNLLVIEAKPPHTSARKIEMDKKKIRKYVSYDKLKYRYGLFIEFKDNFECTCADLQWYRRGRDKKLQWYDNDGVMIPPENRTAKQDE